MITHGDGIYSIGREIFNAIHAENKSIHVLSYQSDEDNERAFFVYRAQNPDGSFNHPHCATFKFDEAGEVINATHPASVHLHRETDVDGSNPRYTVSFSSGDMNGDDMIRFLACAKIAADTLNTEIATGIAI